MVQEKMDNQLLTRKRTHNQGGSVILAVIAILFLRVVLDLVYVNYVHKYFEYSYPAGFFSFDGINAIRLIESYLITFILAVWLSTSLYRRWRPSGIALVLYFVVVMLPLFSLYGLGNAPTPFVYAAMGSFIILIMVTGLLPKVKVRRPGYDFLIVGTLAVLGTSVYVYGVLLLTGGLRRLSFDLLAVYEVRAEYVQTKAPFMGYFVPWQANVVNMVFLCYALYKRNYWLVGLNVGAQVLLFGMTGHKSFVLSPLLVIGVYFIWKRRNALFYIIGGAAILILASYFLFLLSGNHLAPSLMIRRLFFVPAGNHLIYYDFFSQPENPFVMLSNSILSWFIKYPYDMPVTRVISWAYWGRDFGPNVGYLGDAYAHFGFMGMFLFSMILGLFLRIMDSVGRRLPANLIAAAVATPAMALVNSALFTSLLTHGLILTVVLLWLLRSVVERQLRIDKTNGVCISAQECEKQQLQTHLDEIRRDKRG